MGYKVSVGQFELHSEIVSEQQKKAKCMMTQSEPLYRPHGATSSDQALRFKAEVTITD